VRLRRARAVLAGLLTPGFISPWLAGCLWRVRPAAAAVRCTADAPPPPCMGMGIMGPHGIWDMGSHGA
jgi:hypothetical protein